MNHQGTVPIETERLILRRFCVEDAEAAYKNWMSRPAVTKYLTWEPHTCVEVSRAYIQSVVDRYNDDTGYHWIIEWKETHEPIGAIGVNELFEDVDGCEIGYCMSDRYWGRGIMPEAFAAVIRYLFEEVGFNRIQSSHDPRNPASGRVMEKCGLRYEGTLRQAARNNQGICDDVIRAILREDWLNSR